MGLLVAGIIIATGCGAGSTPPTTVPDASATATNNSESASSSSAEASRPTPTPAPSRIVALDSTTLKGKGAKIGPVVVLGGDYVLRDSVATKRGCHWAVYLDGFDDAPIDEVTTDASGSSTTQADEQGLELRRYTLRVATSRCGSWTVSLRRS
jgi:hypothetical protein